MFFKSKKLPDYYLYYFSFFSFSHYNLSGIILLISIVGKKESEKGGKKSADKWRVDSRYISSVITLLYLDTEMEKLLPIAGSPWGLVNSVNECCSIAFFTSGCRCLFGPTNTQVDN